MKDENANQNSLYQIPNYIPIHQIRKGSSKGGGVSIYIHKTLNYKLRCDKSICNPDIEALTIKIIKENKKNLIITGRYRPPRRDEKNFRKEHEKLIENKNESNKQIFLIGDINLNSLDYETNNCVKNFNLSFKNSIFPITTRPTRVTRTSTTSIDHILTNAILTSKIHSGILQTDISDHFPIFTFIKDEVTENETGKITIFKRDINETTKETFKNILKNYNWDTVKNESNPNNAYDKFIEIFSKAYDIAFPVKEVIIKTKTLLNPWFTKGIKKSSKKKQKLHEKFLKKGTRKNEEIYKTYKNLFERVKKIFEKKLLSRPTF